MWIVIVDFRLLSYPTPFYLFMLVGGFFSFLWSFLWNFFFCTKETMKARNWNDKNGGHLHLWVIMFFIGGIICMVPAPHCSCIIPQWEFPTHLCWHCKSILGLPLLTVQVHTGACLIIKGVHSSLMCVLFLKERSGIKPCGEYPPKERWPFILKCI